MRSLGFTICFRVTRGESWGVPNFVPLSLYGRSGNCFDPFAVTGVKVIQHGTKFVLVVGGFRDSEESCAYWRSGDSAGLAQIPAYNRVLSLGIQSTFTQFVRDLVGLHWVALSLTQLILGNLYEKFALSWGSPLLSPSVLSTLPACMAICGGEFAPFLVTGSLDYWPHDFLCLGVSPNATPWSSNPWHITHCVSR